MTNITTPTDKRRWHEELSDWASYHYKDKIANRFQKTTEELAEGLEKKGGFKKDLGKQLIPIAAGGGIAVVGYLLLDPIQKVTKVAFKGVKGIVTGFGLFERIPLLGGLFTGLGSMVATAGDYAGYVVPALGGLIGYSMMSCPSDAPLPNSAKTAYHHTGRVGDPPVMTTVTVLNPKTKKVEAKVEIPISPATVKPLTADTQKIIAANDIKNKPMAEVRALREQAIAANRVQSGAINRAREVYNIGQDKDVGKHTMAKMQALSETIAINNRALDKALEEYMGQYNKLYENRRNWVAAAEKFRKGPRMNLVQAMVRIGMSSHEAQEFVPDPPKLPPTIYADGSDFPPELISFAEKFEECYGQGGPDVKTEDGTQVFTFVDNKGDTPRRKTWKEMSVTQKEEFLAKAIRFVEGRHAFFENRKKQDVTDGGLSGPVQTRQYYDYEDEARPAPHFWSKHPHGQAYGMDWEDEHKKLQQIVGMIRTDDYYGIGLTSGGKLQEALGKWREQQGKSDEHKDTLFKAEPKIKAFAEAVKLMKKRLELINAGKAAVISHFQFSDSPDEYGVRVKDCHDPDCPVGITLCFKKRDGQYVLTEWKNAIWQSDEEKGGLLYASIKWQAIAKPAVLTAKEFEELVNGKVSADALVAPLPTMQKKGISIEVAPDVEEEWRYQKGQYNVRVTDNRDPAHKKIYLVVGKLEDGKLEAIGGRGVLSSTARLQMTHLRRCFL